MHPMRLGGSRTLPLPTELDAIAADIAAAHRDPRLRVKATRLAPLKLAEAMAVQGMVLRLLGDRVPVVKVALAADSMGIAAPIPSRIVIDSGGVMVLGDRDFLGLEVEVAAHLAVDLTAALAAAGPEAMLGAIAHFSIGIEVIGSRIDDRRQAGPFGPLADNLVTGGYVRGATPLARLPLIDGLPIVVRVDGEVVREETARHPFGDAIKPIAAYAKAPNDHFGGLAKGMVVTTGSLSQLLIVPRRGHVAIRVGDLPEVSLTLA
jgi:2-keto-4-pentenoate hydratase